MKLHKLYQQDPYTMMTRVLHEADPIVAVDVGANVGWSAVRIVDVFPLAHVYAFEPAPDVFEQLASRANERGGITPICASVCERDGQASFHITRNHECSSLLVPSAYAKRVYAGFVEEVDKIDVETVSLDSWAGRQGIERIDLLKIDVQGAERRVLDGAVELLERGISGIVCEAQIVPEYEGAATLTDIDLFLRDRGYTLHQVHELACAGDELQTSYINGLWLHSEARGNLLKTPFKRVPMLPVERMGNALQRLANSGVRTAAIFGAGAHTRRLALAFAGAPTDLVAIIDDDPSSHGQTIAGLRVMGRDEAIALGIEGIVLSSDVHEDSMWDATTDLRDRGVRVERLYPPRAANKEQ
ncbi:MAG: FkbM family methyltransferase [Planctomycetota bacterium]